MRSHDTDTAQARFSAFGARRPGLFLVGALALGAFSLALVHRADAQFGIGITPGFTVMPRGTTPRVMTPRVMTPRVVTPRTVMPRTVTPRLVPGEIPGGKIVNPGRLPGGLKPYPGPDGPIIVGPGKRWPGPRPWPGRRPGWPGPVGPGYPDHLEPSPVVTGPRVIVPGGKKPGGRKPGGEVVSTEPGGRTPGKKPGGRKPGGSETTYPGGKPGGIATIPNDRTPGKKPGDRVPGGTETPSIPGGKRPSGPVVVPIPPIPPSVPPGVIATTPPGPPPTGGLTPPGGTPPGGSPPPLAFTPPPAPPLGPNPPPPGVTQFVPNEVILNVAANTSAARLNTLLRQNNLTTLETFDFTLTGRRLLRLQINNSRTVTQVINGLRNNRIVASIQPNYYYDFQAGQRPGTLTSEPGPTLRPDTEEKPAPTEPKPASTEEKPAPVVKTEEKPAPAVVKTEEKPAPVEEKPAPTIVSKGIDPAQYGIAKLRLPEAHTIARGEKVLVAVIDSPIDIAHPDLKDVVQMTFNLIGKTTAKPHTHGTAMAGAIASQGKLLGVAPAVRILAVQAFGPGTTGSQGTTFAILRGIEWAARSNARVINMSFAGPADSELEKMLQSAKAKGIVLIAAAGNAGVKSPTLYPAGYKDVIAVTATDIDDKAFVQANRGTHIAIAAPGVDVMALAPDGSYTLSSGTSIAAAQISGLVALLIERNPGLTPDAVRKILMTSAKDLGTPGVDPEFGAGLADAFEALQSLAPKVATPGQPTQATR